MTEELLDEQELEDVAPVKRALPHRRAPMKDPGMRRRELRLYAAYCGWCVRRWINEGNERNAYLCARLSWRNALKAEGVS